MHLFVKGLIVVIGLALASSAPTSSCPSASTEDAKKAGLPLADFAVNLLKNVSSRDQSKNTALSPVSIALGLALLENGADGESRDQLKKILLNQFAITQDVVRVYQSLQEQLKIDDGKTKLTIANGLFYESDLEVKEEFLKALDCYKTQKSQDIDFHKKLEESRQKINKFVSDKTNGKVPELFKKGDLKPDDRLVLANAVYFKAQWKTAFNETTTKRDTFYRNGRDQQTVQFMQQTTTLRHLESQEYDALELAYNNRDLAMYVVLPKERDGLKELEKKFTGQQLREIVSGVTEKKVEVQLPKFALRSNVNLKYSLNRMGLTPLFTDEADFRRLSDTPLKVSGAVHEAYISIDENGTEAAAATGIQIENRALPIPPRDQATFKADHPFLYAVVHKETGAVVFLGKVVSIEQQE